MKTKTLTALAAVLTIAAVAFFAFLQTSDAPSQEVASVSTTSNNNQQPEAKTSAGGRITVFGSSSDVTLE